MPALARLKLAEYKLSKENTELREALSDLIDIIDAAGLDNLSNGVQLGSVSWYVKAEHRLQRARAIAKPPQPSS